jgi:hypothetical protein
MTEYEYLKLKAQREILQHVITDYGENRSLGNVLQNICARIKGEEKRRNGNGA